MIRLGLINNGRRWFEEYQLPWNEKRKVYFRIMNGSVRAGLGTCVKAERVANKGPEAIGKATVDQHGPQASQSNTYLPFDYRVGLGTARRRMSTQTVVLVADVYQ
jgi:hypothetical protein